MRIVLMLLLLVFLGSCFGRNEFVTLRIKLTCTPAFYFNQLDHVLLTNSSSDLDGKAQKGEWLNRLVSAEHVYAKDLKRNADGHFYIDSVAKSTYLHLILRGISNENGFSGSRHQLDFSNSQSDTVETTVCIESNFRVIN